MKKLENFWNGFVSNTVIGSCSNFVLHPGKLKTYTYRSYIKPTYCGTYQWKFWFCNTVDSTFADGKKSSANAPGGHWIIQSACIADGGTSINISLSQITSVTFDGSTSKEVSPDEQFWSDEVTITIPENHYLVFSWAVFVLMDNEPIPFTPDSQIPCFVAEGDRSAADSNFCFTQNLNCVKPNLFAIRRNSPKRFGFLGDSITQGCGTMVNQYEFWAAKIGQSMRNMVSTWNLGLGYARAKDAATGGVWLYKACKCDEVAICLGVNDILNEEDSAEQILSNLRVITGRIKQYNKLIRIILFTVPPLNSNHERLEVWNTINKSIRNFEIPYVDHIFDIASILSCPPPYEHLSKYGDLHPDGNGGSAVAEAFLKSY